MPTITMLNVKDDNDEIMEDDDQVEEEESDDQEEEESEEENQRSSESENEEEEEEDEDDGESDVSKKSMHQDTGESTANSSSSSANSITVTLTDPDVLDCPICFLPLTIPVFQCDNGHIACSSCCSIMIKNMCPSCSLPIGYSRCRAIEKVIESIKISCTNIAYGCKERISYNKKLEHEQMCIHEPCSCPHPGCDFVASSKLLYLHYYSKHLNSAIPFNYNTLFIVPVNTGMGYVILQESVDKTLFVLNYGVQSIGNVANITCIAPSSVKKGFSYELVAYKGDSKIKLESLTESMPRWSQYLPNGTFLLVPSNFLDSLGGHFLHVRISSGGKGKL